MSKIISDLKKIKSNLEYKTDDTYLLNTQNKEKDLEKLLHDLDEYQTFVNFNDKIVKQKKTLKKLKKEIKKQKNKVKNNKKESEQIESNKYNDNNKELNNPLNNNIDENKIKNKFLSEDYKPKPYGTYKKKYKRLNNKNNKKLQNNDYIDEEESEKTSEEESEKTSEKESEKTSEEESEKTSEEESEKTSEEELEKTSEEESEKTSEKMSEETLDNESENISEEKEQSYIESEEELEKVSKKIKKNKKKKKNKKNKKNKSSKKNKKKLDDDTKNILDNMNKILKGGNNNYESNIPFYMSFIPVIGGMNFVFMKENYSDLIFNNNLGLINFLIFLVYHIICVIEIFAIVYLILNYKNTTYLHLVVFIVLIRIVFSLIIHTSLKKNKINNNTNIKNIELYLEKINNILINPNIKLDKIKKEKIKNDLNYLQKYYNNIKYKYYFLNKFISLFTLLFPFIVFMGLFLFTQNAYISIIVTITSLFLLIPYINMCMMNFDIKNNFNSGYIFSNIIEKIIIIFIAYHIIIITTDKYFKHLDFKSTSNLIMQNCLTIFN